MATASFDRARLLLAPKPGLAWGARLLSLAQAAATLALLAVVGLAIALVANRGTARVGPQQVAALPAWLSSRAPVAGSPAGIELDDVGLYAIVARNLAPPSPGLHRRGARLLGAAVSAIRPLQANLSSLALLLAASLTLVLLIAWLRPWRRSLSSTAAGGVAAELRDRVHRQMYRLGQSSLPSEGTGPVVTLFTREVNEVRDGLAADLDRGWGIPFLGAGLLLIALFLSWPLSLFLLALAVLVTLVAVPIRERSRGVAVEAIRDSAVRLALLHEDLGMLRTIRVFGGEAVDKRRFDEHLEAHRAADEQRMRAEGIENPTFILLVGAAAVVAAGLLGYAVLQDRPSRISPATAALVLAALGGLFWPILKWRGLRDLRRLAARSLARIEVYLDQRPELQQAVGAQFLAPLKQQIRFENVSLEAADGRLLLSGVTLEIPAKSRTAILGLDEEEKHALVCLIPRLIDPKVGRVRMDGIDLRDVTLESLRAQIATVLQADLVFSDTVLANIGLGDASYGLGRVIEAAKLAHAHHFIRELPHGYETVVGPLGHDLTPDQAYRISLARAYLHDPSVVVVEEPTTPLDEDTKHLVDDTIDRLAAGRTMIFLPHRLSTIRKCDQVIVLQNGKVESAGSPKDLHGISKLFRHIQYVEFNQFATGEIEAGQMNG